MKTETKHFLQVQGTMGGFYFVRGMANGRPLLTEDICDGIEWTPDLAHTLASSGVRSRGVAINFFYSDETNAEASR